jgi:hypothetical protein
VRHCDMHVAQSSWLPLPLNNNNNPAASTWRASRLLRAQTSCLVASA